MDEIAGRNVARRQGLRVIGLLGILLEAKKHRLIGSMRETLDQLEAETTFFVAADLKARVLKEAGEAK
jgi:predicted nucleic acid-binding protein